MDEHLQDDDADQESPVLPPAATIEVKSVKSVTVFLTKIEELKQQLNLSYMDAVLAYCEEYGIEIETVATIIKNNALLKAKIQAEAEDLHYLPKTAKLPVE